MCDAMCAMCNAMCVMCDGMLLHFVVVVFFAVLCCWCCHCCHRWEGMLVLGYALSVRVYILFFVGIYIYFWHILCFV